MLPWDLFVFVLAKAPRKKKTNNRYQVPSLLKQGVIPPVQSIGSSKDFAIPHHPSPDSMRQTSEFMEHLKPVPGGSFGEECQCAREEKCASSLHVKLDERGFNRST